MEQSICMYVYVPSEAAVERVHPNENVLQPLASRWPILGFTLNLYGNYASPWPNNTIFFERYKA